MAKVKSHITIGPIQRKARADGSGVTKLFNVAGAGVCIASFNDSGKWSIKQYGPFTNVVLEALFDDLTKLANQKPGGQWVFDFDTNDVYDQVVDILGKMANENARHTVEIQHGELRQLLEKECSKLDNMLETYRDALESTGQGTVALDRLIKKGHQMVAEVMGGGRNRSI